MTPPNRSSIPSRYTEDSSAGRMNTSNPHRRMDDGDVSPADDLDTAFFETLQSSSPSGSPDWACSENFGARLILDDSSTSLLVTFGGIWDTDAQPGFEFVSTASALSANRLYLTDLDQVWYQHGIRGLGTSVEAVAKTLRRIVRQYNFERVIVIGNSAGGYAALLFGMLMRADVVHAFSPQTELLEPGYGYFPAKLSAASRACTDRSLLDLRQVFTKRVPTPELRATRLYVHYSRYSRKDRHHAHRIEGLPGVDLVPYHNVTHGLAAALRHRGLLSPLLDSAINDSPYDIHGVARRSVDLLWRELSRALRQRFTR